MRNFHEPISSVCISALIFPFLIAGTWAHESTETTVAEPARRGDLLFTVQVNAGENRRTSALVKLLVDAQAVADQPVTVIDPAGRQIPAQISLAGIEYDSGNSKRLLTFIAPEIPARTTIAYTVHSQDSDAEREFKWHDDQTTQAELQLDGKGVVRYMYEALDDATEQRRAATCKTYHHVFSPDGTKLLTKGTGGLYPHHRGIFFGFNRISYDNRAADNWHCGKGESQTHSHCLSETSGPVYGRHANVILWNGRDGEPFATEVRQITCYRVGDATLIDFHATVKSNGKRITLDGDPQHAGVQFRASQQVADQTREKTFYIRPDGVGQPGQFRNWSDKPDETGINRSHRNLPFNAMVFVLDGDQYTCAYLDHPDNPKPAMYSERDYGRFGSYFRYELTPEQPLHVRYRYWLQEGTMTVAEIERLSQDFVNPVAASVN